MKNTIRVSRKNTSQTKTPQGKKPSIHGQETATFGKIKTTRGAVKTNIYGKVPYETLCMGLELGLSDEEIQALSLITEFEGRSVREYFKIAIVGIMEASAADFVVQARDAKDYLEKTAAQNVLSRLKLHMPVLETAVEKSQAGRRDGLSMLFEAVRESESLNALMLNTLENRNVDAFREANGYLAAGVRTLMRHVKHDLEMASDALSEAKN